MLWVTIVHCSPCSNEAPIAVFDASVERSNITPSIGCGSIMAFVSSALQALNAIVSAFQGTGLLSFFLLSFSSLFSGFWLQMMRR